MQNIETQLNEALRQTVLDVRSLDLIDLATAIYSRKYGNVSDLVQSALELHFKPGTMRFSNAGLVELSWFGRPAVSLDMEFCCLGVDVFFSVSIEALHSTVCVRHFAVGGKSALERDHMSQFYSALDHAKIASPRSFEQPWPRLGLSRSLN